MKYIGDFIDQIKLIEADVTKIQTNSFGLSVSLRGFLAIGVRLGGSC